MGPDFELDVALVKAARQGLGPDIKLAVDAGTMWKRSASEALKRALAFEQYDLLFLEEPVLQEEVGAYRELVDTLAAQRGGAGVRIAGGEVVAKSRHKFPYLCTMLRRKLY